MKKSKTKKKDGRPEEVSLLAGDGETGDDLESRPVPVAEYPQPESPSASIEVDASAGGEEDSIEALKAKIDGLKESLLRSKAECQNIQRRSAKERADAVQYANARLMKSVLGVLDDFERSLASADQGDDAASVIEGVRLVHANLVKALSENGLQAIEALHQHFDPHVHEAVMQQPSAEFEAGTVLTEVARGYRLHERVLRPTKVVVSKASNLVSGNDVGSDDEGTNRNPSRQEPQA